MLIICLKTKYLLNLFANYNFFFVSPLADYIKPSTPFSFPTELESKLNMGQKIFNLQGLVMETKKKGFDNRENE